MVKKFYLFRMLDTPNPSESPLTSNYSKGVIKSDIWPLLGLERKLWKDYKINSIQDKYVLKPFEVRQKKFNQLVESLDQFGVDLVRINFANDLYDDEHKTLIDLIRGKDINGLLEFIEEQRYDFGNDIEEVTFKEKDKKIHESVTFSRNAVLTAPLDDQDFTELISSKAIGLLAGTYIPVSEDGSERSH
jgi:hypothetical protein